jgi:transcription elongation factor GreA
MEELEIEQRAPVLLTAGGHARLKEELKHLTVNKRAEIAERIRESKDHGEFSEDNNELDEIKIEQGMVESRISELKSILSGAEIFDPSQLSTDEVDLGLFVTVEDIDRDFQFEVQIVASIEANADMDMISEESPMGNALMNLKVGEVAEFEAPAGTLRYKVIKIRA